MGYDKKVDPTSSEEQGLAKTIWKAVMEELPGNQEWKDFEKPEGIIQRTVCKVSGQSPFGGICPAVTEYFDEDTTYDEDDYCSYHYEEYLEMKRREEEERKRKEEEAKKKAAEAKKKKKAEEAAKKKAAEEAQKKTEAETGTETKKN